MIAVDATPTLPLAQLGPLLLRLGQPEGEVFLWWWVTM